MQYAVEEAQVAWPQPKQQAWPCVGDKTQLIEQQAWQAEPAPSPLQCFHQDILGRVHGVGHRCGQDSLEVLSPWGHETQHREAWQKQARAPFFMDQPWPSRPAFLEGSRQLLSQEQPQGQRPMPDEEEARAFTCRAGAADRRPRPQPHQDAVCPQPQLQDRQLQSRVQQPLPGDPAAFFGQLGSEVADPWRAQAPSRFAAGGLSPFTGGAPTPTAASFTTSEDQDRSLQTQMQCQVISAEQMQQLWQSKRETAEQLLSLKRALHQKTSSAGSGNTQTDSDGSASTSRDEAPQRPFASLREVLQHLSETTDLSQVLTVRRVRRLGVTPEPMLWKHFQYYGCVKSVLTYPVFKATGGQGGKSRLGDMAFVVMASARSVENCLSQGNLASVCGTVVEVSKFERAYGQAGHAAADAVRQ